MATIYDDLLERLAQMEDAFICYCFLGVAQHAATLEDILDTAKDGYTEWGWGKSLPVVPPSVVDMATKLDLMRHNAFKDVAHLVSWSAMPATFKAPILLHMPHAFGTSPALMSVDFERVFSRFDLMGLGKTRRTNPSDLVRLEQEMINGFRHMIIGSTGILDPFKPYGIPINAHHLVAQPNGRFMALALLNWVRIYYRAYMRRDGVIMHEAMKIFTLPAPINFLPIDLALL
ncbi:MAG: hypothetical protein Q7R39_10355 [Dehalococcoidia bacterium]|nr:hypothetical protein [Dehalococcoidia bacterium]